MSIVFEGSGHVAGEIIFNKEISREMLIDLLEKIRQRGEDERWVDLYTRPTGESGRNRLCFHYILPNDRKATHDRHIHGLLGFLKQQLGTSSHDKEVPNGVKSWSISTVTDYA